MAAAGRGQYHQETTPLLFQRCLSQRSVVHHRQSEIPCAAPLERCPPPPERSRLLQINNRQHHKSQWLQTVAGSGSHEKLDTCSPVAAATERSTASANISTSTPKERIQEAVWAIRAYVCIYIVQQEVEVARILS